MERNKHPYSDVDWNTADQIVGCSHMHCTTDNDFHRFVNEGLEFATFANYYPSAPWYPLRDMRENTFKCRQKGCTVNGKYYDGEIDFGKEIASWKDELPDDKVKQLPFKEGERIFTDIPPDLIEAPNAEYHSFTDTPNSTHVACPGSTFSCCTFDRYGEWGLNKHGFGFGVRLPWREGFDRILGSLITPDGGGITINHPASSHLPLNLLCDMLDYDSRVLGIEVFNHNDSVDFTSSAETLWDVILGTGRQCFGFFVEDHNLRRKWRGKIMILSESRTAESCLKAIRQGNFYGMMVDNGLRFEYINFDGRTLTARTNRPATFKLASGLGIAAYQPNTTEFTYTVKEGMESSLCFLRLTAREGREEEKLYAQPFMLI